MKSRTHIIHYTTSEAWCGVMIDRQNDDYLVGASQALREMRNNPNLKPCPDCARAIIKQLLKAID